MSTFSYLCLVAYSVAGITFGIAIAAVIIPMRGQDWNRRDSLTLVACFIAWPIMLMDLILFARRESRDG